MLCDHSEAVAVLDTHREAYRSEYHRLAKGAFPTGSTIPELGVTSNLVAFLTAIRANRSLPAMPNENTSDDLEEMCEALDIKKEEVKRMTIEDIYKHSTVKPANQNVGLLTSFTIEGCQGSHIQVVSDSGCTGAIMDQAIPSENSLPVALKGNREDTNVGGGGRISMESATFLMPYKPNSQYNYQEVSGMLATRIVNPPPKINISNQMDTLFNEYIQYCNQEQKVPKFSREDCPSEYGGKRVDVLLGSKEISPVLEFRASSGLEVFSHPFTTPKGVPKLAVGGSIPTSDANIINQLC